MAWFAAGVAPGGDKRKDPTMDIINDQELVSIAGEIVGRELHEEPGLQCLFDATGTQADIHSMMCYHPSDDDGNEVADRLCVDVNVWDGDCVADSQILDAFARHGYRLERSAEGDTIEGYRIKVFEVFG